MMKNYSLNNKIVQNIISQIKKSPQKGKVFVYETDINKNSAWINFQHNELKFWDDVFFQKKYFPDYVKFSSKSMQRWKIDRSLFDNKVIVEIGCGPYGFLPGLLMLYNDLHCFLIAIDSLLSHYQRYPTFKLLEGDNIIKIQAPAEDLPLPNSSVDVIVCQNTLDHVNNPDKATSEMARILKPNGISLLDVHTIPAIFNLFIFKKIIEKVDINHPHHFSDNEVINLLSLKGFQPFFKNIIKLSVDHPCSIMNLVKTKNYKSFVASRIMRSLYLKARVIK